MSSELLRDEMKIRHGILEEIRGCVVESWKEVGKIRRFENCQAILYLQC